MSSKLATYRNSLPGAWRLVSMEVFDSDSPSANLLLKPFGEDPYGVIHFGSSGYCSCSITARESAAPIASPSWSIATDDEILRVARTFTQYAGPWVMYEENGEIFTKSKITIALDPSWIGTEQVRRVHIEEVNGKQVVTLRPTQLLTMPVSSKI